MLQSQLFGRTYRQVSSEETSSNAQLLIKGGYIEKVMAGVYAYLPLGKSALDNITALVRSSMNGLGAQEISLSALQPRELWDKTGRWELLSDVMYHVKEGDNNIGLGISHEEPLVNVLKSRVQSYRDYPVKVFQIQTKFRNEPRAKSGLLRGREFLMKDMYSFHIDEEEFRQYYDKTKAAYGKLFTDLGLKAYVTTASGGVFTDKENHEFQVLANSGEDKVYICSDCGSAWNQEVLGESEAAKCSNCKSSSITAKSAIEVGHIFKLGSKYTDAFAVSATNSSGQQAKITAGCYGIGISRLLGTIAEVFGSADKVTWPVNVAPFKAHILPLFGADALDLYKKIKNLGIKVLLDDRELNLGPMLNDSDLIGAPYRIEVKKSDNQLVFTLIDRIKDTKEQLTEEELLSKLKEGINAELSSS